MDKYPPAKLTVLQNILTHELLILGNDLKIKCTDSSPASEKGSHGFNLHPNVLLSVSGLLPLEPFFKHHSVPMPGT